MITELNASFESNLNLKIQEEKLNYQLLQSQINPHFLYNILASVQNLLSFGEISKADKMLADLSRFYRGLLRTSNDLIPIKKNWKSHVCTWRWRHYVKIICLIGI